MIYALLPPANEVWGKVIFFHLSVILFTGGSASVHAGILPPPTLWEQTPQSRHPRGADTPLGQTPPCTVHAGRYGQQAGGMHPTGMQSCYKV